MDKTLKNHYLYPNLTIRRIKIQLHNMLFTEKIRQLRDERQLLQRQLNAALEIDTSMYRKIERGDRKAKREQVVKLAELLQVDSGELLTLWLEDQTTTVVIDENK